MIKNIDDSDDHLDVHQAIKADLITLRDGLYHLRIIVLLWVIAFVIHSAIELLR